MELIFLLYLLFIGSVAVSAFLKRAFATLKPQTFEIVMLGPRGVGKTSVLAGISHAYDQIAKSIAAAEWEELKELRLGQDRVTKEKISRSIADLESTAKMVQREDFPPEGILPPINPTDLPGEFTFYLSASDQDPNVSKTLTLNFHDYPGAWMRSADPKRPVVVEKLRKAQIVIVAVDAPHLMEERGRYQENRNAGTDVLNMLRDADAFASGPGVLLLVPNRCEKYLQDSSTRARIPSIVKEKYAGLISHFAQAKYKDRVRIAIVPVQTVGCIEFDSFSTARFYPAPDGTPFPIFWPLKNPAARRYNPKFLHQIVYHVVIHALEKAAALDTKASANFEKALPKLVKQLNRDNGFEIVQAGREGGKAYV